MTTQELLLGNLAAAALLGITIYISRATFRRVAGAAAGGIAAVILNVGQDKFARSVGWWHFPSMSTPQATVLMYTAVALWYGAGVALIGWRATRRFGWQGLVTFIGIMSVYGPARDYLVARFSGAIVFAPGISPIIADAACWASGMALAQGMMRLFAGPARNDPLAR
ncbi:MAG: hypothetical protein ACRD50_10835 [Candidatus Acidiferrales bacterium]